MQTLQSIARTVLDACIEASTSQITLRRARRVDANAERMHSRVTDDRQIVSHVTAAAGRSGNCYPLVLSERADCSNITVRVTIFKFRVSQRFS